MNGARPRAGLRLRLIGAMVAVAVLAFCFAALLTAPLLRSSAQDSARATLGRQADLIAALPRATPLTRRLDAQSEVRGLYLGVITPNGRVTGAAAALDPAAVSRLTSGSPVSASGTLDGEAVLVEARPVRNGGAIVLATSAAETDRSLARQRRRLQLALLLGLAAALVGGAVMAGYLARPLTRLAAAAGRMGAGERGVPLPDTGTREVAEVADALGHLDAALAASEDRQRRFLLSVSHELRTPLTAIRGYAESLADDVIPATEVPAVATTMLAESRRLEGYVVDLLGLARLEADDFALRLAPLDLAALVEETSAAWQARAGAVGVRVLAEGPRGPLMVDSDGSRLRQVLDALVDNAVRVCSAGAVVVLAAGPGRLEVRDSGPGLAEADVSVAFEPGVLHDRYAGRRPGGHSGHGLGLAIAHRLVTRLGGTIAAGQAPEGGAAFVIVLPTVGDAATG